MLLRVDEDEEHASNDELARHVATISEIRDALHSLQQPPQVFHQFMRFGMEIEIRVYHTFKVRTMCAVGHAMLRNMILPTTAFVRIAQYCWVYRVEFFIAV